MLSSEDGGSSSSSSSSGGGGEVLVHAAARHFFEVVLQTNFISASMNDGFSDVFFGSIRQGSVT